MLFVNAADSTIPSRSGMTRAARQHARRVPPVEARDRRGGRGLCPGEQARGRAKELDRSGPGGRRPAWHEGHDRSGRAQADRQRAGRDVHPLPSEHSRQDERRAARVADRKYPRRRCGTSSASTSFRARPCAAAWPTVRLPASTRSDINSANAVSSSEKIVEPDGRSVSSVARQGMRERLRLPPGVGLRRSARARSRHRARRRAPGSVSARAMVAAISSRSSRTRS